MCSGGICADTATPMTEESGGGLSEREEWERGKERGGRRSSREDGGEALSL